MGTDVLRIGDFLRQISKGANVLDLSMRVWSDAAGQRRAMRFIEIQRLRSIDLCDRMRPGWWRGSVVERRSLAGELSLSCARPAADG